jgi:two-component system cell cycle sensor histidine kinase/response regulator CckA
MASRAERSGEGPGRGVAAFLALGAAFVSAALLFWAIEEPVFVAAFLAGIAGAAALLLALPRGRAAAIEESEVPAADVALLRAALDAAGAAVAVTDADGALVCASRTYCAWFGGAAPPQHLRDFGEEIRAARRDGSAVVEEFPLQGELYRAELRAAADHLVWTFERPAEADLPRDAARLLAGEAGRRLGAAGVMAILTDDAGTILAANPAFAARALGEAGGGVEGSSLVSFLAASEAGQFHFAAEGKDAAPIRIVQVAAAEAPQPLSLFLLFDDAGAPRLGEDEAANIHALLDSLPLGLALADRDGRFTYLNRAFRRAAGLSADAQPAWPGDLLVDEDKAAVSDAVRRFARGRTLSGDIAVRLKASPDDPVSLTIAGARGLGEAAVLLSLKDNSEEARLKREVAQATKMQAIGQLAGGVAHDFNNILTAILGYCDLMLMRHTPGDSDYDDIQQIRSNSNRAANLTRQLLAFSRQQTLRPQVLQLPDVVSEVSNLLKRLLGETVKLEVKHGRGLGPVRADPGQLEQVIVNLAVNARDAMLAKSGGTLTIHTYAVTSEDVRRMGSDILPIGDYTALKVSDTGTGIPPHLLAKIFEPFFTTKEVGKGTGLGLSTVYGIVKQSGGFIFSESEEGKGASFTLYLPVHRADAGRAPARAKKEKEGAGELWGTGTILLVEDETTVRAVAERALTRHGYTVFAAENGEAALEILAREGHFDLMISDVVMPTMDGPTTVREARKTHPDLPILFISGYAEEQLRKSIDLDRVSFLAKPFSVQKLAEAARDTIARG